MTYDYDEGNNIGAACQGTTKIYILVYHQVRYKKVELYSRKISPF